MAIHVEHGEHLTIVIFTKPDASSTYEYGYIIGELPPNYPVPALADTVMVNSLAYPLNNIYDFAWDGIWRTREELGYCA